jgi:hypothetical protein
VRDDYEDEEVDEVGCIGRQELPVSPRSEERSTGRLGLRTWPVRRRSTGANSMGLHTAPPVVDTVRWIQRRLEPRWNVRGVFEENPEIWWRLLAQLS